MPSNEVIQAKPRRSAVQQGHLDRLRHRRKATLSLPPHPAQHTEPSPMPQEVRHV